MENQNQEIQNQEVSLASIIGNDNNIPGVVNQTENTQSQIQQNEPAPNTDNNPVSVDMTKEDIADKKLPGTNLSVEGLKQDIATPGRALSSLEKYRIESEAEAARAEVIYKAEIEKQQNAKQFQKAKEESLNQFNDTIIEQADDEVVVETTNTGDESVTKVDLTSIKIKKTKDEGVKFKSMLERKKKQSYFTKGILPVSGYTASLIGMSSPEIRNASDVMGGLDRFGYLKYKYENIFKRITETSIGNMSFDTFLKRTALMEYEVLAYCLFNSTFPDTNEYPSVCPKCGKRYSYKFDNKDFLNINLDATDPDTKAKNEKVLSAMLNVLKGEVVNAQEIFDEADVNKLTRKLLKDSMIIVELRHPTLWNQLYDVVDKLSDAVMDANPAITNILPFVSKVYFPDPDSNDSQNPDYIELANPIHQVEALSQLSVTDDENLAKEINDKILNQYVVSYSLKQPACPQCKHKAPNQSILFDNMLFTMHQIKATQN